MGICEEDNILLHTFARTHVARQDVRIEWVSEKLTVCGGAMSVRLWLSRLRRHKHKIALIEGQLINPSV